MASEVSVLEAPEEQVVSDGVGGGPGPKPKPAGWVDNFNSFLTKNPTATDDQLFKQFPELGKDSKRLDAAFSYIHAKSDGVGDDELKKLYPDLIGPAEPYINPQNKVPIKDGPDTSVIPKLDTGTYDKMVTGQPPAESTAMPAIKQQVQAQKDADERDKKIQAKYKPMMEKVMSDIDENKEHFVEDKRPALDFHPDAPDSYYEQPKMSVIDDYLKKTITDPTDRYYVRNKILHQFQEQKDEYTTGQIADKNIMELPAVKQAKEELYSGENFAKVQDQQAILKRAQEIDPSIKDKVNTVYQEAAKKNEDIKNETTRNILNNSTSLVYDSDGNLKKVNTLGTNSPFHDQITGAGKALQGIFKFSGQVGQMASGVMKFFGAKESGYNLQKAADDFIAKNAFPEGNQTPSEFLAGDAVPMMLQGAAMGKVANLLGTPAFKALAGASARGMIGKFAEGALGGIALAPINSALISHDYYTQLVRSGEAPEIAKAKAEHVFDKNIVTDMLISPIQFGIMNAPVKNVIAKAALQYGVSPAIAGTHFMAQDYFQQKESNPALTAWKYATSPEGMKTGITGALTGLVQHFVIGKMNDWQNAKNVKDAFSFGRKNASPETAELPNNNVLASTVLNAFEMKDSPRRAGELKGLVDELHAKGVYNEAEAANIQGIIDDVAAVKGQVPKMGTSPQRMAVFNELLNKRSYESQLPKAGNSAVVEMLEGKMKESDQRIQKIMNEEEPLYFINGIETSKDQLMEKAGEDPEFLKNKAVKIDIIGDDETKQAVEDAKLSASAAKTSDNVQENETTPIRKLTPEAIDLLDSVNSGSKPAFISKRLEKIAADNGVEVTGKSTPDDIINKLRDIQNAKNKPAEPVIETPGVKEEPASEAVSAETPPLSEKTGNGSAPGPGKPIAGEPTSEKQPAKPVEEITHTDDGEDVVSTPKDLPGRSPEFSSFYHGFKDEIANVKDSSFDFRLDMPMDQKTREGAIRDIEAGKKSKRAQQMLDELQRMHDSGMIELTRGLGNHVEKFGIPIEEWNNLHKEAEADVVKHVESGEIPENVLAQWLEEESTKTHDNAEPGETGQISGEDPAGPSENELVHSVREGDEIQAGDRSHPGENEPRSAAQRTEGPVPETGQGQRSEPLQSHSAENVEESHAIHELAERLGRKALPKLGKDEAGTSDRFTSIRDTLKEIADHYKEDPLVSRVINFIKPILDANPSVRFDPEFKFTDNALGYSFPDGRIAINHEALGSKDMLYRTTLHELVHGATRSEIEKSTAFKEDIRDVLTEIRKALKVPDNDALIPLLVTKGMIEEDKYGTSNEHELIAEVFTNQKFNDYLKSIKYNGDSLLKKVYLAIAKHFSRAYKTLASAKANISADNMADYLMKLTESVIKRPGVEDMAGALPMIGKASGEPLEDYVREKLDDYKESTIKKALMVSGGMKDTDAQALIEKVRAERDMSPEEIIKQAIAIGKGKVAGAKKQVAAPLQAGAMKPSLAKTLRRWYFDGRDEVSDVKSIIRQNKGKEEFDIDTIYHATRKLVNFWNTVPKVKQMAFILGVEKPELLANQPQQIQDMAAGYRQRLDKTFETIKKVMPDLNYIEDYFPHFWEKPEQARNFFANTLAKAPMEGSKSFAKKRFFETIVAGLKEGLKLSTSNPEEMVRLAEANAWKFKTAHDILNDMKAQGYVKLAPRGEQPIGWKSVDDPIFTNMAMRAMSYKGVEKIGEDLFGNDVKTKPETKMAALYMPEDVAKLMNEYLSKGLSGPAKNVIQQWNNIKNLFQLGVGFFHFGTTTTDAIVTGMTNGIQKLSAGNPKGLLDVATFGNLPATVIRGFKARADWNAGKLTADTQALMDANAKVGRQKMYSLDAKYNMMKAFGQLRADKDFKQIPKVLWNAMLYLPESINKPLMEHWVPSLKVGGYLRSLDSEISSRKNMTPAELQTAKQKIWDSMDDRLGQVVYDNIFVKKSLKDLAFMAIRSAGWTGGTIRATSGGIAEIPRSAQRLVRGQGLSQRTAYLAALPLTVGLMGAFYQYILTGQGPEEMKDYFFPKDGTKSPDGTDHRVDFPSYMKDILAYSKSPVETLLHKTSPILNDVVETYQNKDFYGERIYNPDDPWYQKGLDILKHQAATMEPFSFRQRPGYEKTMEEQLTTRQGLEQKFGIMPAPRERERNDVQNKIMKAYGEQMGHDADGKTHAEVEQSLARRHLREFIFNGGDFKDASQEWKDKAAITPKGLQKFIHDSQMNPYERYFKQLKAETKMQLYGEMSDEDKAIYVKYIPANVLQAAAQKTEE